MKCFSCCNYPFFFIFLNEWIAILEWQNVQHATSASVSWITKRKVRWLKVAEYWESWKKAADNQKTKWTECNRLTHRGKFWVARTDARSGMSSWRKKKVHQGYKPISLHHCCAYPPVHPASFPLQFLSTFCSPLKEIGYKLWHELALRLTDTAVPKGCWVKKRLLSPLIPPFLPYPSRFPMPPTSSCFSPVAPCQSPVCAMSPSPSELTGSCRWVLTE